MRTGVDSSVLVHICACTGIAVVSAVLLPLAAAPPVPNMPASRGTSPLPGLPAVPSLPDREEPARVRAEVAAIAVEPPVQRGPWAQDAVLPIRYRVTAASGGRRRFLNAVVPERMVLDDLFTGRQQMLDFDTARYGVAAYVPAGERRRSVRGLFLMSDASFLLEEEGVRYEFDAAGYLTDVTDPAGGTLHIEYAEGMLQSFVKAPYAVESSSAGRVRFLNATVPRSVVVKDLIHGRAETLVFDASQGRGGYRAEGEGSSRYRFLALMSDASLRLSDRLGNEIVFDGDWRFVGVNPSPDRCVPVSLTVASHTLPLVHTIDPSGRVSAVLPEPSRGPASPPKAADLIYCGSSGRSPSPRPRERQRVSRENCRQSAYAT